MEGEPLDPTARAFHELKLKLVFYEKGGAAFQGFFCDIMDKAHPGDFQRVRPYGREGDGKCDGFLASERTVFQVYAPREMKERELIGKINTDFTGARKFWVARMECWTFVHNDREGLPPYAQKLLLDIEANNAPIRVDNWGYEPLRIKLFSLSDNDIAAILGPPVSREDFDALGFEELRPVLLAIQTAEPPVDPEIRPVSAEKLAANSLSDETAALIRLGRQKEKLVESFLSKWNDPTLGEKIAEAFRTKYSALAKLLISPDDIFLELRKFAGGSDKTDSRHEVAVLAVLSYFFERCDIFEEPR
jgi:hypothetical protein